MKIKQRESLKLYYGKYPYKVLLSNQLSSIFSAHRTEQYRDRVLNELQVEHDCGNVLKLVRWRNASNQILIRWRVGTPINTVDFENAKYLNQLFKDYSDYRKRVEFGDQIIIYTSDEDMVNELVDNLSNCIKEIHRPKEGIEAFLTQNIGTAIVKTPPEHEFRVYLNGKHIDPSFANWLRSNSDKCKVGEMTLWNIENSSYYTNNSYFYIKNDKVLTMIRMIVGHNIRKVERLVYQGDIDKYTYANNE